MVFSLVCAFALWMGYEMFRRDAVRGPCEKSRGRWDGLSGHGAGAALFVSLTVIFQSFLPGMMAVPSGTGPVLASVTASSGSYVPSRSVAAAYRIPSAGDR